MAVAKRQRREKPTKIEQRKVWGQEWEPRVKQTALLASSIYVGQAQEEKKKHIKRGAKIEPLASLQVFWVGPPSHFKDAFSFACQIKLSCNTCLSGISNFCCGETEQRKLQTPPTQEYQDLEHTFPTQSSWLEETDRQTQGSPVVWCLE